MISLNTTGLKFVFDKFESLSNDIQSEIQLELNAFGADVARDAQLNLKENKSENLGTLKMRITSEPGSGNVTISADTKYAAYVEFGTRKLAASYVSNLPEDWQAFANTFKGPMIGGSMLTRWEAIKQWGEDKGLEKSHIYHIYKKLIENGSKPHPFMYPAINKNIPILIENIKALF